MQESWKPSCLQEVNPPMFDQRLFSERWEWGTTGTVSEMLLLPKALLATQLTRSCLWIYTLVLEH